MWKFNQLFWLCLANILSKWHGDTANMFCTANLANKTKMPKMLMQFNIIMTIIISNIIIIFSIAII